MYNQHDIPTQKSYQRAKTALSSGIFFALALNAATSYAGAFGNALSFDGLPARSSTGDYVSLPLTTNPTVSPPFTIEAWIKPNGNQTPWASIVTSRSTTSNGTIGLSMNVLTVCPFWDNFYPCTSSPLADGVWQHVAVVFRASSPQLFVDGTLVQTFTGNLTGINPTVGYFNIGYDYNNSSDTTGSRTYKGVMDEVRIWSVDKSADIVNQSYRCSPLSGTPAGLLRYYKFDETTGTTTSDSSGNSVNGILKNGINNNPVADGTTNGPLWVTSTIETDPTSPCYGYVPPPPPPPLAPTNLTATPISSSQIDLSWTDNSSDETGFKIYRDGVLIHTTTANVISYSDLNLACNRTYTYELKATHSGGDSAGVTTTGMTLTCAPVTISTPPLTISTPPLPDYLELFLQVDGTGHGKVTTDTGLSCQSSDCQIDKLSELKCNPQACSQLEKTSSYVTLTPHADPDSVFSSWGGNEDCVDGKVFMNSGILCIAFFHRIYQLTVALHGSGQVMGYDSNQQSVIDCGTKCQTSVSDGTRISLQATSSQGMMFGGWSGDCGTSTQNPLPVEVTKEMKCQATFVTLAPVVTPTPVTVTPPVTPTTPVVTPPVTTTPETTPPPVTVTTPPPVVTPPVTTTPETTPPVVTTPPVTTGNVPTTTTVETTPLPVVTPPPVAPAPIVAVTPPPVVTVLPVTIAGANFTCPTTGDIWEICNYGGREVTNLDVQNTGIVSNGVLNTTVVNTGWVSNFHITATGKLSGGVVTGYIVNEGVMLDFEFVGMSIIGGTLGGVVHNNSRVGGYFQDVTLLPNTKITGGILRGIIKGDKNQPAVLENVRIKGRSKLSGVKLGKNVKLEKGVRLEDKQ